MEALNTTGTFRPSLSILEWIQHLGRAPENYCFDVAASRFGKLV